VSDKLFLGVDGGGTRTRARLRDGDGRLLGEGSAGPGNARLGMPAFDEVMKACRQSFSQAGLGESVFAHVSAGFGLAGTHPEVIRQSVLRWPHPFHSLEVCTDAYAGWLGAFGGADGAILIAGTGTCGLAVVGGKAIEVGGLGSEIGDEGSGMAIGRAAVRRSLWALEGRWPMTPLANAVLSDKRIDHSREQAVVWGSKAIPGDFADFAPLVFAHAEKGDPMAVSIVEEAAADIAHLSRRLLELGAPRIGMIGTLFDRIVPWLPRDVAGVLIKPERDAVDGAILLAKFGPRGSAGGSA
jgi:glucosamine kinase